MRWCASTRRREESSDNVWKSRLTAPYLWCCLAVRSRPSDPQQRRPDGRTACDGDVEHRAGCFWPNVDAAYWRYRRLVCRDPPSMAEPCAADNGGQSRRVCSRLAAVYPTSAVRRASLVLIAEAVLLVQHKQTDRQTETTERPTHGGGYTGVRSYWNATLNW